LDFGFSIEEGDWDVLGVRPETSYLERFGDRASDFIVIQVIRIVIILKINSRSAIMKRPIKSQQRPFHETATPTEWSIAFLDGLTVIVPSTFLFFQMKRLAEKAFMKTD
jgi:hypothetical protein